MPDAVFPAQPIEGVFASELTFADGTRKVVHKLTAVVGEQFNDSEGTGLDDPG